MPGVECVILTKEDMDNLLKQAVSSREAAAKAEPTAVIPETLTVKDIKAFYGISKTKWMSGVASGAFPAPIAGFERPKRWSKREVEAALRIGGK